MVVAAGGAGPAAASCRLLFMMGQCCCLKKILVGAADQKNAVLVDEEMQWQLWQGIFPVQFCNNPINSLLYLSYPGGTSKTSHICIKEGIGFNYSSFCHPGG